MSTSDHIAELLRLSIEGGTPLPMECMPSVRELANRYSTSPSTVIKALRTLSSRGLILKTSSKQYRVMDPQTSGAAGTIGAIPARQPPRACTRTLVETISREVITGQFGKSFSLPTIKELAFRFGCNHRTIKAALDICMTNGILERTGRRYHPAGTGARSASASSVYFVMNAKVLSRMLPRHLNLITGMEDELHLHGWNSVRLLMGTGQDLPTPPLQHAVAGLIYLDPLSCGDQFFWFHKKNGCGLPMVIVDCLEEWEGSDVDAWKFAAVMPDNAIAGATVGMHLAKQGHIRVALFTDTHLQPDLKGWVPAWARKRIAGLRRTMNVRSGISMVEFGALNEPAASAGGLQEIALKTRRDHTLQPDARLYSTNYLQFRRALQDSSITAWVCLTDDLMAAACYFLQRKGVSVPSRISLVSFDNSPAAYKWGVTSYDFGYDRLGHAAVRFLVAPSQVSLDRSRCFRVEGRLFDRGSSASPCETHRKPS